MIKYRSTEFEIFVASLQSTRIESPEILTKTGVETVLDEATEDYWAGSGSGPEDEDSLRNETRESLAHEASDQDAVRTLYFFRKLKNSFA